MVDCPMGYDTRSFTYFTQAELIIRRFGGHKRMAEIFALLGMPYNLSTIYRWNYPKEKGGTGGVIPTTAWPEIQKAARLEGVLLKPEDFDPNGRLVDQFENQAFPKRVRSLKKEMALAAAPTQYRGRR